MTNLSISDKEYKIIDTKEKITVPDCIVWWTNKIWSGSGESVLYLWQYTNKETTDFFKIENENWNFEINCFIKKQDLIKYLNEIKDEYFNPQQLYGEKQIRKNKKELSELWEERMEKVKTLKEIEFFSLKNSNRNPPRIFVKSDSPIHKLIRELALPSITYLSAIKLENKEDTKYYFRLFVDYFGEKEHPIMIKREEKSIEKENIDNKNKKQLVSARIGQGKYREKLYKECPFCPITSVSDDRLLIASHIKPWVQSNNIEKIDPKNGFMFTPNIDKLFDRGFITFTDDKKMITSPWISKMTYKNLNIIPNKTYLNIPIDWREDYLKYHRENIFKK